MADVRTTISTIAGSKLVTFALAAVIGLGIGSMASPSQVALPAIGSVSSLYLGGAAVVIAGGALLARDRFTGSGCGCDGDCGC